MGRITSRGFRSISGSISFNPCTCTLARGQEFAWNIDFPPHRLVLDGSRWIVNLDHVHESGRHATLKSATRRRNPDPKDREAVLKKVIQAYRVLLTRAMKGVYMWCSDARTRDHLRAALGHAER